MGEEATNTPQNVPLPVLPSSGKVEELRRELQGNASPSTSAPAQAAAAAVTGKGIDAAPPEQAPRQRDIERKVEGVLRTIFDPEIPVNIFDLGLIYEVRVDETDAVYVKMTLTAPACPVAGSLPGEVEAKIENIPEVRTAEVELVWDPPWSKDRMSESAMLDLGFL